MRATRKPHFNLLLFGAPGVGKGTFAKFIQRDFLFKQFSTGDYFRSLIKKSQAGAAAQDDFTRDLLDTLNSGKLVDDSVVVKIAEKLFLETDSFMDGHFSEANGIILDGVPRTVSQAESIARFAQINLLVNFHSRDDVLVQKMMGRRLCPSCNKNFNVAEVKTECGYEMAPLLPAGDPEFCDDPSHQPTKLIQRDDDREEVILERLELYRSETLPILEFYQEHEHTQVINFEAKRGVDDYPILKSLLEGQVFSEQQAEQPVASL